jgi:chemotaxis protein methyltransferase CheR
MTKEDFSRISGYIFKELGIKMPPEKQVMLQSRLLKRLSALKIDSFKEYFDFVFSKSSEQQELIMMIDLVTTNKTDFFREPGHFEYLREFALPELLSQKSKRKIKIWSAGCSSGEEPYTLAIVLKEFLEDYPGVDFEILGTDLSMRILEKAYYGIYPADRIANIPLSMKQKYFLKSKKATDNTVRVKRELRSKMKFQRLNFMDDTYAVDYDFDIVFCRNVIIYFERDVQEKVINKLTTHLKSNGHFFIGHSESLTNMNVPLQHVRPTIFRRT